MEHALFSGGCFWCIQPAFSLVKGVSSVVVGYTGGDSVNPTYEEICSGESGHVEAVDVTFDPSIVTYEKLLDIFWESIDPFDATGQFADRGSQYETVIFYHSTEQKKIAEHSKKALEAKMGKKIATKLLPAKPFYPAEDYHQDYARKNPIRYKAYRVGSGRDAKLKEIWKK